MDRFRIVFFDTETCPLVKPVVLSSGRSVPNVNNAAIVQLAFADINGKLIVPNTNLNPEVKDWSNLVGYTQYVENAWGVKSGEIPAEAARLPTFAQSIMAQIYTLRTQVSKRLIVPAHNGNGWDFPIFRRQMMQAGYKFPDDMEIITLDTQYIAKECVKRLDPKDRKWALGYTYNKLFGEDIQNQHTASGDVFALARILRYWAKPYCGEKMTEADIVAALFAQKVRGLSRSELHGVLHVRLPDAPGGPKDKKEVIGKTPEETITHLQALPAIERRALLSTLESVKQ